MRCRGHPAGDAAPTADATSADAGPTDTSPDPCADVVCEAPVLCVCPDYGDDLPCDCPAARQWAACCPEEVCDAVDCEELANCASLD